MKINTRAYFCAQFMKEEKMIQFWVMKQLFCSIQAFMQKIKVVDEIMGTLRMVNLPHASISGLYYLK
jgi:hypothetical protein